MVVGVFDFVGVMRVLFVYVVEVVFVKGDRMYVGRLLKVKVGIWRLWVEGEKGVSGKGLEVK